MILNHHKKYLVRQSGKGIGNVVKNIITSDFVRGNLKSIGKLLLGRAKDMAKNILLPAARKMAIEAGTQLKDAAAQKLQDVVSQKMSQLQLQAKNPQVQKLLETVNPTIKETSQNIISNLMAGSGFKIIPVKIRKYKKHI
jgi:hypothetical protein